MIVCATDLSASARAATAVASWLARRFQDSLLLLHVIEPIPAVPDVLAMRAEWLVEMRAAAEAELEKVAHELRSEGVRVEVRVVVGEVAALILQHAQEGEARFITIGTHGRKGAARLFLGSVAERVSADARCPVIVTREAAAPATHWPATRPLNLAVATDGSSLGQAALDWVGELRRTIACDVTVVRIYSPAREAARYGLDDPWVGRQGNPEVAALVERDTRRALRALPGPGAARIRLVAALTDPADELAIELTLLQPDAVVIGVGQHRPTWPDLPMSAVLRSAPVPVICVGHRAQSATAIPEVRSVLVPTDFSEPSSRALSMAYALLRPRGGRVELCTVHERGPAVEGADLRLALPLDDQHRDQLEARLRAMAAADAEATGIVTRPSVIEGRRAPEAIVRAAERLGVDLIVMASHGRSGLQRALLGSVAEEVARQSPKPVLIVHGRDGSQG
jgi:nucleotide-binding universal stress UspA family protein